MSIRTEHGRAYSCRQVHAIDLASLVDPVIRPVGYLIFYWCAAIGAPTSLIEGCLSQRLRHPVRQSPPGSSEEKQACVAARVGATGDCSRPGR